MPLLSWLLFTCYVTQLLLSDAHCIVYVYRLELSSEVIMFVSCIQHLRCRPQMIKTRKWRPAVKKFTKFMKDLAESINTTRGTKRNSLLNPQCLINLTAIICAMCNVYLLFTELKHVSYLLCLLCYTRQCYQLDSSRNYWHQN